MSVPREDAKTVLIWGLYPTETSDSKGERYELCRSVQC